VTTTASAPWTLLAYGPAPDQVAEVTVPPDAEGPLPLVLLLHGGVWREPYDRVHIRPLAAALAATGVIVANVEYRRVDGAGGWPNTFDDVAASTDALPHLIDEAHLAQVDRSAIALVGHSAGGHLALWSTLRHLTSPDAPGHRSTPLPVAGVVPLAGVVALTSFHRTSPDADTVTRLMGGDPDAVPDRYLAADPTLLGAPECRVVLVHGSEDEAVPIQTARDYATAHDGVALVELPGTGHFEVIDPGSTAWPAVRAAVREVLGRS